MNASAFSPRTGYQRLRLTVDDVDKLAEVGVIDPDARTELIDGELIFMPSEGELHINYKAQLVRWFNRMLADDHTVAPDSSLHLAKADAPQPDLYVFDSGARLKPIDPSRVQLVIEVSDTSLGRDLETKVPLYARYGLAEYWVIDIGARMTHVHLDPRNEAYAQVGITPFGEALRPTLLSYLPALIIADLPHLG